MPYVAAKDIKPGDEIDGKTVVAVRNIQFHKTRTKEQHTALTMVNDHGFTIERACDILGLVEGVDWRWCD